MSEGAARPEIPKPLQRRATDEFVPPQRTKEQNAAVAQVIERGPDDAHKIGSSLSRYWSRRTGTAAGLLALNEEFGGRFYDVPEEARYDEEVANATFEGPETVIDVQTHFMSARPPLKEMSDGFLQYFRGIAPEWWRELDDYTYHGFTQFVHDVFLETENAVVVLSAPPPDTENVPVLTNEELVTTKALLDRLGGAGRLLSHAVVMPTTPGQIELMQKWHDTFHPAGWKVYTTGHRNARLDEPNVFWDAETQWWLDDEQYGIPFLEEARRLSVKNVCVHKGLSVMVDNGSPRDVGPVAKLYPDLRIIVYHSAYEPELTEGPYSEATADLGMNRLIASVEQSGIKPGENVYAELGTTWFCLMAKPLEAAHCLGKLLLTLGEDNILWGTDSIWYGGTQPIIDAFRTFQIPEELSERYGYPQITPQIREKILSTNAARVYDIDLAAARQRAATDDLSWVRAAMAEYEAHQPF